MMNLKGKRAQLLHNAAQKGNCVEVERLLSSYGGVGLAHQLDENQEYPLYTVLSLPASYASNMKQNKEVIFEKLLMISRDVLPHQNLYGDTVLHRIAKNGFTSLVDSVLQGDATALLRFQNDTGHYPVHTAALNGRLGVLQKLLSYDEMPNLPDRDGNLPLHLAANVGSLEMVKMCFEHYPGGIHVRNTEGKTPLDLAHYNTSEVQEYLIAQGAEHGLGGNFGDTYVVSRFE